MPGDLSDARSALIENRPTARRQARTVAGTGFARRWLPQRENLHQCPRDYETLPETSPDEPSQRSSGSSSGLRACS